MAKITIEQVDNGYILYIKGAEIDETLVFRNFKVLLYVLCHIFGHPIKEIKFE